MKYSNQHDEKPFTIEGELQDNEELPDADADDTDAAPEEGGRVEIETDQDATSEGDAPGKPTTQIGLLEALLKTLGTLFITAPEDYREAGNTTLGAIRRLARDQSDEIAKLRAELRQEKDKQAKRGTGEHARSWASTPTRQGSPDIKWSQGNPFTPPRAALPNPTTRVIQPGDARKQRQLLIRVRSKEEQGDIGETAEEILRELKDTRTQREEVEQLETARRLRSGDLLVQTTTVEAKKDLEENTTWLTERYTSASVIRKTYPVIAHGIKVEGINTNAWPEVKKKIERDNHRLHPDLEIMGIRWLSSAYRTKKYSSLVLDLPTPEIADALILNGIVDARETKNVERYDQAASLTRCYKCQEYGHIARTCKNEVRCAECNQAHDTRVHKEVAPAATPGCAACGKKGKGHTAYDADCPFRTKMRKCTAKRLAKKRPFYGQYQQRTGKGESQGGEKEMRAEESKASILGGGPEERKAALREKIKEYTQDRKPSKEESILIQTEIAKIRALEKEIAAGRIRERKRT